MPGPGTTPPSPKAEQEAGKVNAGNKSNSRGKNNTNDGGSNKKSINVAPTVNNNHSSFTGAASGSSFTGPVGFTSPRTTTPDPKAQQEAGKVNAGNKSNSLGKNNTNAANKNINTNKKSIDVAPAVNNNDSSFTGAASGSSFAGPVNFTG